MKCKNCGADNKEDSKFCASCGQELVAEKEKKTTKKKEVEEVKGEKLTYSQNKEIPTTSNPEPVKDTTNSSNKTTDGKATASLVLGICSVVIFCLMWPLALIGLILGIASKERSGKRTAGIVINAITLAISTIFLLIVFVGPLFSFNLYTNNSKNTKNFFEDLEEKLEEIEEETESKSYDSLKKDVKKVGDDDFGYVEVPSSWIPFKDVDVSTQLIQYTDIGEAGYIVTLNVYEDAVDAQTAAQNLNDHIKEEGNTSYYLTTYVGGYRGYVVHATYTDGTYLDIYLFKADDEKLHYVAIEGPDRYNDNFDIPKTFTLKK